MPEPSGRALIADSGAASWGPFAVILYAPTRRSRTVLLRIIWATCDDNLRQLAAPPGLVDSVSGGGDS
jgi:hypothetical protein